MKENKICEELSKNDEIIIDTKIETLSIDELSMDSCEKLDLDNKEILKNTSNNYSEMENLIIDHFSLECEMCSAILDDFADLKKHYEIEHKIKGYVQCCGRKFFRKRVASDHVLYHRNPELFKCNICDKICTNSRMLRNHVDNHMPDIEKRFECSVCYKKFSKEYLLRNHEVFHIPVGERNLKCEFCQKM